jgi:hypothetical protein
MRTLGATFFAAVLVLVTSAPASALTGGFGVAKALQLGGMPLVVAAKKGETRRSSCEADSPSAKRTAKAGLADQVGREIAPVACEQPPRSQVLTADAFKQATAAALAVLG